MAEAKVTSEEKNVVVCSVNYKQVAKATDGVAQNENMFKELVTAANCHHYPAMLKNCTQVHIGPKIEIHSEEPGTSFLKKEDEERDEIFKNCCQKMKDKYLTYFSYMRSFLWEGKRNDFPLKDYFVELTVEKADLFGKNSGDNINLNDIFAIEPDGHRTILVTGDPGYGKSTLCKKLVYDWASTNYLQQFQLTVIVILRELGDKSVKDALLDTMYQHSLTGKDWNLQDRQLNILVILDGFDEIVEKSKIMKFIREESFDISRRMTIMITSRNHAAEDIREDMNMRFSIEGFSPEYQEKYIQLMFREDDSKANKLFSIIKENDFYREIAQCPLMLHMLCCLHQSGEMENLETMTDLYIRIFSLITERYVRKTNQKSKFKRGKYFVGENLLLKLGVLYMKFFLSRSNVTSRVLRKKLKLIRVDRYTQFITSHDLEVFFPNEDEYNFIIGLDILTLDSFSECNNTIQYRFVHRTFGEFLSALSIYIGYVSFREIISETDYLCLFGFYKDDPLPKKLLRVVDEEMFTPEFMFRAHKQIKLKTNWEKFCFHSKVEVFSPDHLYYPKYIEDLLKLYDFKEIYLYFHEPKVVFKDRDYNASSFFSNWSFPCNVKIFLLLHLAGTELEKIYDIREPVTRIIDFLHAMSAFNIEIYFIGVKFVTCKLFYSFTNVNFNLNLSVIRGLLHISEDEKLVGLECVDLSRHIFIISLDQYENLRDYIKFQSKRKQKLKCVMM